MSETVQTTVRCGISGQFLDNPETFSKISVLYTEFSSASDKLRDVEIRRLKCNDPVWLPSFKKLCQRLKRDYRKELVSLVQKLEAEKTALQTIVNETREKLLRLEPSALNTRDTLAGPFFAFSTPPAARRMNNPDVVARNSVIDSHPDESDKAICELLDEEFPSDGGRPATGMPDTWFAEFGVRTYLEAYQRCRQRVHTLISKRRRKRHLP